LEKELSGFVPEFKEIVDFIEDPDLKQKVINAGKKQRASIDRKLSELGEQKKLNGENLENYSRMDKLFKEDPTALIKTIAQSANVNLNDLVQPVLKEESSEDDYRLPEEIKRDQELADIKKELYSIKYAKQQEEQLTAQQEINKFVSAVDDSGNLKYPHFEQVRANMSLLVGRDDNMDLDKAYNKAVLLDDELSSLRDKEMLRIVEAKRKYRVEKAKKLKKQSPQSSNLDASIMDPDSLLNAAYEKAMSP